MNGETRVVVVVEEREKQLRGIGRNKQQHSRHHRKTATTTDTTTKARCKGAAKTPTISQKRYLTQQAQPPAAAATTNSLGRLGPTQILNNNFQSIVFQIRIGGILRGTLLAEFVSEFHHGLLPD